MVPTLTVVSVLRVLRVLPVLTEWVADEQNEETLQDSLQSEGGGWSGSPHAGGGWGQVTVGNHNPAPGLHLE